MPSPTQASDQPRSRNRPGLGGEIKLPWQGNKFRVRLTTQRHLASLPSEIGVQAVHIQAQDSTQLLFMAMVSLARDLYSRQPEGSREFENLVNEFGLKFITEDGRQLDVASLLQKR